MPETPMTIEQIDAHLNTQQQGQSAVTRDLSDAVSDVCKTYSDVRPILVFAKGLLFFKPKWQSVLQSLIEAMDKTCNVQPQQN